MKLSEIEDLWTVDSELDRSELAEESLKIPRLHSKYFRILSEERIRLRVLENDKLSLKRDKYEFFKMGDIEKERKLGWKYPDINNGNTILNSDIPLYMDSDTDIQNINLKIVIQLEKIELLKSIIQTLNNRGFHIKNCIDWLKFTHGND